MECPECHTVSEGRFCPRCGAALSGVKCAACDAELPPGARYCTQCGKPVVTSRGALPWIVTGLVMVALIGVLVAPSIRERAALSQGNAQPAGALPPGMSSGAGMPPGAGTPPPLTGTPREQADRLFNRVMNEEAAGNTEQARFFAEMAVSAYGQAGAADADALFHVGLLELVMGDGPAAVRTAERILTDEPTHLLALAVAAQGSLMTGDTASGREFYGRFLDNYDAELARALPEYTDHARVIPDYRTHAETIVGGA